MFIPQDINHNKYTELIVFVDFECQKILIMYVI